MKTSQINTKKISAKTQNQSLLKEKKKGTHSVKEKVVDKYSEESRKLIEKKAYELYKNRGCQNGYDKQDWLEAEEIVCRYF